MLHGEPSLPAAMAWAAFLRASREGDGPFYRRAMEGRRVWARWKVVYWGRRGRGGRSQARRVARPWQHRGEQERNGGACRAQGNARRAGSGQTQGRGSGFGRRRDAWGGQVASLAYGAAVGEVQGDGGGRIGQWQSRN